MAVREGSSQQSFSGFSTDEKPLTGVQNGASFHVLDTGEEYVFHDGMWESDFRNFHNDRTLV